MYCYQEYNGEKGGGGVPWVLGLHQFNIDYYLGILEDIAKKQIRCANFVFPSHDNDN